MRISICFLLCKCVLYCFQNPTQRYENQTKVNSFINKNLFNFQDNNCSELNAPTHPNIFIEYHTNELRIMRSCVWWKSGSHSSACMRRTVFLWNLEKPSNYPFIVKFYKIINITFSECGLQTTIMLFPYNFLPTLPLNISCRNHIRSFENTRHIRKFGNNVQTTALIAMPLVSE